jgi:hypothetical protein
LNPQAASSIFFWRSHLGKTREDRRMHQEGSAKIFDTPWSATLYQILPNYTKLYPHSNSWRISLRDVKGCLDVAARRRQCWKWMMERRIDSAKNRAQGDAYARGQGIQI